MSEKKELNIEELEKVAGGSDLTTLAKFNALMKAVAAKFDAWLVDINATTDIERIAKVVCFMDEVMSTLDEKTRSELINFINENKTLVDAIINEVAKA